MSSVSNDIDISITYGSLFPFISDPSIEEIWINTPERIFIARNGRSELTNLMLTADEVRNIVERALNWSGRRLDLSQPFVDSRLPDGSRLHVAIPEITAEHWAVNIRKHLMRHLELNDLAKHGVMTLEIAEFLQDEVIAGANILVSGGTQAGKTTLLNALVSAIPTNERVVTVEEVFELKPELPDVIAMQTRSSNIQGEGEIPLRRLIKESLRMRPQRIIVGEVREAEALDLLISLNSGLPGMGTIHANTACDAVMKLQTLPLLAGENISMKFVTPTVASALDLVVHVKLEKDGKRRVSEIVRVTGRTKVTELKSKVFLSGTEENMKKALDTNFKVIGIINKKNDLVTAFLISAITFLLASALTSSITIGAAFCTLTGAASRQFLKQRKENRQKQLSQVWPDVIDHLVAGLYSGQSITESIADLEYRGPELVRSEFSNFRKDIKSGLDFNTAINNLRNNFSHHGSDQIFEALQLSKTLGGGELLNTLRTLGSFQREDLMLNKEIAIKHGWIKNSAHISAAAPWVLLLMIGTQSGTAASFATATGMMILFAGVVMTFLAYSWMSKISRLPIAPRVFRG